MKDEPNMELDGTAVESRDLFPSSQSGPFEGKINYLNILKTTFMPIYVGNHYCKKTLMSAKLSFKGTNATV